MAGRLDGRVAIVTGGAMGIGRAIAERYLAEGASVVIADVDDNEGQATEAALKETGSVRYIRCNVANKLDIHNLLTQAIDEFGHVDILVNNAGILATGDFLTISEEDFDRVIAVNLKGAFLCGQAVAGHMVERAAAGEKPGCIINMSSINAVVALPTQVPYTVSKGGINQLTRVMALSLAPHGIRVNAIGPGSIATRMLQSVFDDPDTSERILSRTPLGRTGEPSEIAGVATFLASDDASYVTGQTIYADGGRLPLNYTVPVKA